MRQRDLILRIAVLALLAYSLVCFFSARDTLRRSEEETRALEAECRALREEQRQLQARQARAGTAEEMRRLAWERLGLVQPGEIIFRFDGEETG